MAQNGKNTKRDDVIDDNLKRVYRDMLDQEVPDRFLDLLAQLKEQDSDARADTSDRETRE